MCIAELSIFSLKASTFDYRDNLRDSGGMRTWRKAEKMGSLYCQQVSIVTYLTKRSHIVISEVAGLVEKGEGIKQNNNNIN